MADDNFWGDLGNSALQALMLYFGNKYGSGSGDTPNFYPVPLTPEQKYWDDAKKKTYEAGGSPQSQAVFSAGRQFLEQMPTGPTNHSFLSPLMQGQTYAGGMQLPKFDFSKIPFGGGGPSTPTQPPPVGDPDKSGPHGWQDFGDAKNEADPRYDPLNPPSGGGPFGPSPYGLDSLPTVPGMNSQNVGQLWQYWQTWKQEHPNWAKLGVNAFVAAASAAFGLAGGAVAQALRAFVMRDMGTPQIPTGRSAADMFRNAPGVAGGPPSARDLAGPQPNRDATYDPATGRWVYNPSMTDQSWSQITGQFNHNLANMVGPQPPGSMSHVKQTTRVGRAVR